MNELQRIAQGLKKKKPSTHLPYEKGLSCGSTLINLACTGRPDVAFLPGYYYFWVGDSGSGKTFLTLTALAEAAINRVYKDYQLVFDQPERGALMDFRKFFGPKLTDRLVDPKGKAMDPARPAYYSTTLEEFYYNVDRAVSRGPCVYLLDSMDALTAEADKEHFDKGRKAADAGKKLESGSYGMAKAKTNSSGVRMAHNRLGENGSILIIIGQTRQNVGPGAMFNPSTRSGGKALTFYAALELWTKIIGHAKATERDHTLEQGVDVEVRIKKGRLAGKDRRVNVSILHNVGIDDLGSCVDYLVEWKHWKGSEKTCEAPEFEFKGSKEKLIRRLEEAGREDELRHLVAKVWNEIEEAIAIVRKPRYL